MASATEITNGLFEAWKARDYEKAASFYAEDVEITSPGGVLVRGRAAARDYVRAWGEAFFDLQRIVHRCYDAGQAVIAEGTLVGTHTGSFQVSSGVVVRATNRRVEIRFCETFVVQSGFVVRDRLYFDQVELLSQLSVLSATDRA
jgi:ketosteroid isomerase-like protein